MATTAKHPWAQTAKRRWARTWATACEPGRLKESGGQERRVCEPGRPAGREHGQRWRGSSSK
eukprot:2692192-Alexandrium_andersonii.AAC.1